MKYQNTRTGVVIDVKSKISGGFWVPLQDPFEKKDEKEPQKRKVKKNE